LKDVKKARSQAISQIKKSKKAFEHKVADKIKSDNKSFYAYARGNIGLKIESVH